MKNVVFITVDSLRADYVFGSEAPESLETLPRLADGGIRFTNAFSNAAYTKGSFLSILSGTYPWMFDSDQSGYGPDRPHVAELLSDAGYATAGFHTNAYLNPVYNYDRGFDHYLGRDTTEDDNATQSAKTVYTKLIERIAASEKVSDVAHQVYNSVGKHLGVQLGSNLYKPAGELNEAVVRWIRECSQPAFVWIHYMDVHTPYYPHEGTVSEDISRRKAVKLFYKVNELRGEASAEDIDTLESLYRGEIEYLDQQLGVLFDRLDETLDLDNTVVAFTSDHGEAFNEKGYVFHPGHVLYDENVHIPMILSGPGIEPGTVETPVSNADLVPTLLSQVGLEPPESTVGENVTSFLSHPPDNRRVFAEAWTPEDGHVMVTDGRYKLIRHLRTNGEEELYDRHQTPKETHDLSHEGLDIHTELSAALDEHIRFAEQTHGRSGDVEVPENVRRRLRRLGYDE